MLVWKLKLFFELFSSEVDKLKKYVNEFYVDNKVQKCN